MKKIYMIAAAVALAANAYSQSTSEVFAIEVSGTYTAGTEYGTENCILVLGEGSTPKTNENGIYKAYLPGSANPKDGSGAAYTPENKNLPTTGAFFKLTPKSNGLLSVGMVLNTDKPFFVVAEDGSMLSEIVLTDKEGNNVTLSDDYKVNPKFYGTCVFDVVADKTYYVFCTGSKLGFYGFTFTEGASTGMEDTEVATVPDENAPIYNILGQKVDKSYKGVVIQNGKKYVRR